MKILEPCIAALRGRNPENPSDRTAGAPTQQRLEINNSGCSNALTTVQKDNIVVEPSGVYTECSPDFQRKPLPGVSRTLKAEKHDSGVFESGRIRKLTPVEYFRLMGFDDDDHAKAVAAGVSNSQLYKQAGNSIVVNVLEAILGQLF